MLWLVLHSTVAGHSMQGIGIENYTVALFKGYGGNCEVLLCPYFYVLRRYSIFYLKSIHLAMGYLVLLCIYTHYIIGNTCRSTWLDYFQPM